MHADRPGVADLESVVDLLSVLSGSTKLSILFDLADRPMTVGALCRSLHLSQSLVSHHLSTMRKAGLVRSVRRKQEHVYTLGPTVRIARRVADIEMELRDAKGTVRVLVTIAGSKRDDQGTIQVVGTNARSPSSSP